MALWLNRHDIESVLTMDAAITAVENAFRQLATGAVVMPQRVGFGGNGGGGAAMPAYIGGEDGGLGIKVVTLFGGNVAKNLPVVNGTLLLLEPDTGRLLAVMDAGYMTAVRTGAVGGVAAKYLAREESQTVTIFGAGVQARAQLEAACAVRPIRRALVVDALPDAAARFAAEMSEKLHIEARATDDVQAAVEAADILVTATTAHDPIFDGNWLRPGVHINGIGSHAPAARELDTTTVQRSRIVADQRAACLAEAGDLLIPLKEGEIQETAIAAELGEIVAGSQPGRENAAEITLFKSVGLAIQDVAVAVLAFQQAQAAGIGQTLR
ncbi:MAG: ornithine cyclodeaminase family protein [Anaerolineaceae bacterium]|nr:ornithine cyclodeaminase family protein [Anaerolineaceae bacterium]